MRQILNILVLFFLLSFVAVSVFPQKQDERILLWSARTQSITNEILVDINKFDAVNRANYYAKLGETWWISDKDKANIYLNKAVDYATSPATDFKDSQVKFQLLRTVLKIVSGKDEKLEKRLIAQLTEASKDLSETDNKANSEAILSIARSLVDTDVQKAFNLGILTLRQQNPTFSFSSVLLFLKIREKNETLANQYFSEALTVAKTHRRFDFVDNLVGLAFPVLSVPVGQTPQWTQVSDGLLRKRSLDLVAFFSKIEAREILEKKKTDCRITTFYGIRLLNQYRIFLPEQVLTINQAINACQVSLESQNTNNPSDDDKPKTIEELLALAEETDNKELKTKYLLDAAHLANQKKNYKFAVEILDKIDEDMRDKPFGVWEYNRISSTASLVSELIDDENLTETYQTFTDAPTDLRPFIRVLVIGKLNPQTNKILAYELLNNTRNEFNKQELKPIENVRVIVKDPTVFNDLTTLYIKFGYPNDAVESHLDAIRSLNRYIAQITSDTKDQVIQSLPLNWSEYGKFNGLFFENNFEKIEQNFTEIEFLPIRLDIRMQWLKNSLQKQIEIEKELVEIRKNKK